MRQLTNLAAVLLFLATPATASAVQITYLVFKASLSLACSIRGWMPTIIR
jgi:hypothetical protein